MCANTSTCLAVKMKFVPQIVLECGKILYRGVKPKTASGQKYSSGFDVTGLILGPGEKAEWRNSGIAEWRNGGIAE